jgi:hypothetical protein
MQQSPTRPTPCEALQPAARITAACGAGQIAPLQCYVCISCAREDAETGRPSYREEM